MISYQESLNIMCVRCVIYDDCKSKNCTSKKNLQELIVKSTPTKPYYFYDDEPLCPYCHQPLDEPEQVCEVCNQLIDWSDENE